jgi:putative PIN family toxin of toxin-antitoxin system
VIDTNLVLSALVFGGGAPGALCRAWQEARFQPLLSTHTAAELLRALAYPKFKLSPAEQEELLADYLPWCETVRIPEPPPVTPRCRDPSDQPFLHLPVAGQADFLVTGDTDLLALAGKFDRPVVTATRFLEELERPA